MNENDKRLLDVVISLVHSTMEDRLKAEIIIDYVVANAGNSELRKMRLAAAREKGRHTPAQWRALVAKHDGRCVSCRTKKDITKDHIIPIAQGGSDGIDNLQPLCGPCNSSKWAY